MIGRGGITLAVRLDSVGDLVLCGPALRALAAGSTELHLLAGPVGGAAGPLLPGVTRVHTWPAPWILANPPAVNRDEVAELLDLVTDLRVQRAVVFTSFHQSALPTALLLRLAGVPWIGAISTDYPGSLIDLRHQPPEDLPEAERALSLARAAGFELPSGDDGRLRLRTPLPDVTELVPRGRYVVVHPGTSVPARAWPAPLFAEAVGLLAGAGWQVVVTGGAAERALTARVAGAHGLDLGGRTSLAQAAAVIAGAAALVAGNTGPAHLAAATATPVVCLFAPTVPAVRWAPYRVPHVLLGDQGAACAGSRAATCPVPGHPCLSGVAPLEVLDAVAALAGPVEVAA